MKKLIIVLSLVCLFFFGGVCGFAVAVRIVKNSLNEEYVVKQRMTEEADRLKLTPEQIEQAAASYEKFKQELVAVKKETFQAIARAAIAQSMELSKLLGSEQLAEYAKMNEERRLKFERMVKP